MITLVILMCLAGTAADAADGVGEMPPNPFDAADARANAGTDPDAWAAAVDVDPRLATFETWTGGGYGRGNTGAAWALYSGATWAPFSTLQDDGVRLRLVVGAGRNPYDGLARVGTDVVPQHYVSAAFTGRALAGGQVGLGRLTLKAFGGIELAMKRDTPFDPSDTDQRRRVGGAMALEGWLDLGHSFVQLDTSAAQIDRAFSGRMRVGWRMFDDVSFGPEVTAARSRSDIARQPANYVAVGAFARYQWARGEISTSTGVANDSTNGSSRYLTGQVLTRY